MDDEADHRPDCERKRRPHIERLHRQADKGRPDQPTSRLSRKEIADHPSVDPDQCTAERDVLYGAGMLLVARRSGSATECDSGGKYDVTCRHRRLITRHCWLGQCWRDYRQAENL